MKGAIRTVVGRKPWTAPSFDMPRLMSEAEVSDFLGELRGSRWFRHRTLGELCERTKMLGERDVLPDRPMVQVDQDGETHWRVFDVFEPGTFARLSSTPVRAPKLPAPHRGLDALAMTFLGAGQPERIFATAARGDVLNPLSRTGTKPAIKPAEPPARGAQAIIDRLASKGLTVSLSADGQYIVPAARGGRPAAGVVELLTAMAPLILAHLRGGPLLCAVGPHRAGEDPTATSLMVAGCPSCARHMAQPTETADSGKAAA
jgi:hypothetical protein